MYYGMYMAMFVNILRITK